MVVLAYHCLTTITLPVPENNNKCVCSRGLSPDNFKSYFELQLLSGVAMFCARVHGFLSTFVPGCRGLSCYACSQTTLIWTNKLSCWHDTSNERIEVPPMFLYTDGGYECSKDRCGETRNEQHACHCSDDCLTRGDCCTNYKTLCKGLQLQINMLCTFDLQERQWVRRKSLCCDRRVSGHVAPSASLHLNAVVFFHHTGPGLVKCS